VTISKIMKPIGLGLILLQSGIVLAAAGDFDPSYNGLGFTRAFIPDSTAAGDLALDSVGRIIAGGNYTSQSEAREKLVVWRRLNDGTLDPTFGGMGVVYPISPPALSASSNNSIAIDRQDRIVIATAGQNSHFVHRLNVDGSADVSLSGTGLVEIPLGGSVTVPITGVAIQPDNQIVAVGGVFNAALGRREFVAYRLQENGDLDLSFKGTGIVHTDISPGGGSATGIALQPDGKIVVAGRARRLPTSLYDFALARYLPTGMLDPDFGSGGKVMFSVLDNNLGRKVAVQPDGKIVVAGSVCVFTPPVGDGPCYFSAARLDDRGNLDPSFGGTGKVVGDVAGFAYNLTLQSDGKLIIVGVHEISDDFSLSNGVLIRYQSDGSLDPTFGLNGISETNYGYASSSSSAARVQSDGQIVVNAFTSRDLRAPGIAVTARYLGTDAAGFVRAKSDSKHSTANVQH
jgi:uncharacterized delta-60 repeat protein